MPFVHFTRTLGYPPFSVILFALRVLTTIVAEPQKIKEQSPGKLVAEGSSKDNPQHSAQLKIGLALPAFAHHLLAGTGCAANFSEIVSDGNTNQNVVSIISPAAS